jgi:hypothetical protein
MLLNAPSHIVCTSYVDHDHWLRDFNDRIYEQDQVGATWTHLQIRKSDILSRWPKPAASVRGEADCRRWLAELMKASPSGKPKPKSDFLTEAKSKFPRLAARQFNRAWDSAIAESGARSWASPGRLPTKSNHLTK